MFLYPIACREAALGEGPDAFNPVDVNTLHHTPRVPSLVCVDPKMCVVPDIDQSVLSAPPVTHDDGIQSHLSPYRPLSCALCGIRHNFGVHAAAALEPPTHRLRHRAPTPLERFIYSAWPCPAKVPCIHVHCAHPLRLLLLLLSKHGAPEHPRIPVARVAIHRQHLGGLRRRDSRTQCPPYFFLLIAA